MTLSLRPTVLLLALLTGALPASASRRHPDAPPPQPVTSAAASVKPETSGDFHDSSGAVHHWRITDAHTLVWEDTPYVPAGLTFIPASWAPGADAEAWAADRATMDAMHAAHVTDILLSAGTLGLARIKADAVQRVIDYLDHDGMHYGLRLGESVGDPLTGYSVHPSVYRDPAPPSAGGASHFRHIDGLFDAEYVVVSTDDLSVVASGKARTVGASGADVDVPAGSNLVVLLYPRRIYGVDPSEQSMGDLWSGYDSYRDDVLDFFRHIRFGPGLRFFLDPFADGVVLPADFDHLVPSSDGFRLAYEAWLSRQYNRNVEELNQAWRVSGVPLPDFSVAARCVPLWSEDKGIAMLLDPEKNVLYEVENHPIVNRCWNDLNAFKSDSLRGYMASAADLLKRHVAEVPVVFRWTNQSLLFVNNRADSGFDGLAVRPSSTDVAQPDSGCGYAYAEAEDSDRTAWLMSMDISETAAPGAPAFSSRASLYNTFDDLTDIGIRGMFARSDLGTIRATPAADDSPLSWLGGYANQETERAPFLQEQKLQTLWYPAALPVVPEGVRHLHDKIWWLPTYREGIELDLGPNLSGYAMPDTDKTDTLFVIWSNSSKSALLHMELPKSFTPRATTATGESLRIGHSKTIG